MKRSIQKVDKCLSMIENAVIILGLSAMFLILLAQVIMRYVFSRPLTWSEEAARFIFCICKFYWNQLCVPSKRTYPDGSGCKFIPSSRSPRVEVLINLGTIALFCYMIPFSFRFIGIQAGVKATATHIPMSIVYTALPLGMALSCVRLLISSLRIVWGRGGERMILLIVVFAVLMIIGAPVGLSLLGSSAAYLVASGYSLQQAFQAFTSAISNSFTLIAVPFFILAASIMNSGGITKKIFDFCNVVVGWVPGGLGHANILSSVVFAGMSGAAIADAGGLGAIELKAMKEQGFDEDFSLAITGASSVLGPIIPPSVPAILFGVAGSVSIGKLFIGGIIPRYSHGNCNGCPLFASKVSNEIILACRFPLHTAFGIL